MFHLKRFISPKRSVSISVKSSRLLQAVNWTFSISKSQISNQLSQMLEFDSPFFSASCILKLTLIIIEKRRIFIQYFLLEICITVSCERIRQNIEIGRPLSNRWIILLSQIVNFSKDTKMSFFDKKKPFKLKSNSLSRLGFWFHRPFC